MKLQYFLSFELFYIGFADKSQGFIIAPLRDISATLMFSLFF